VLTSWVFFRATTLKGAFAMLDAMTGRGTGSGRSFTPAPVLRFADLPWSFTPDGFSSVAAGLVGLGLAAVLIAPNTVRIFRYREYRRAPDVARSTLQWRPTATWALITACAFAACILGMRQRLEFLYFQF
jgi:hypothetical protein